MEKIFKVHSQDNVFVVKIPLARGEVVQIDGVSFQIQYDLDRGHKIASQIIRKGDKIIKFGLSIGSAIADIMVGEHVHIHNLQSDYLPTYTSSHRFTK
ncbi:UxaA family hydrolase [Sphingobacterium sp. SYP-B4668]|uniref:UxaA family hydrolase n=1 Tax=Sphingobacterium sp. SYP-B4668 TaxID=2996035 RepID=UPI0022DD5402|nr:UxaA family hydrolase [Sphingobacterium sp. SYP-B4668]